MQRKDFVVIPSLHRLLVWLLAFRVTPLGWLVFGGWVATTSMGISGIDRPVYLVVCAWTAPGVIAFLMGWALRPKVTISADFPVRGAVDQPLTLRCALHNPRRSPQFSLGAGLFLLPLEMDQDAAPEVVAVIPQGETVHCGVKIIPRRRGQYKMPGLIAFSTFPLNLYRTPAGKTAPWPFLVLPTFHPIHQIDIPIGTRYQPGGIALTSHVGESPEYIGNREYVPGDPVRHIDFRAWARLSKPAVREFQEEYYCRIALVLDTFTGKTTPPSPAGFPDFEAAVSLTAAVADALSRGEYLIDLFAAGPELHVFRAGRHTAHLDNVLEILAGVGHTVDNPFERLAPALVDELHNISSVVCLFLDWDRTREHVVRAAAEAGCSLKVIVVRDGDTTEPLDSAYAWTPHVEQVSLAAVAEGGVDTL
ncbi:MAG: DUF58 domain-containing protein [Candidatus Hydrogenedentes bacterium]|nr:DUF58 domain-containing protein [Candidatus Hydrogenedentota bacterium]